MGASKSRTLKDGTVIGALDVMRITGITSKATALKRMDCVDEDKMLAPKGSRMHYEYSIVAMHYKKVQTQKQEKYEKNILDNRSAYDPMWRLVMRTIGKPYDRI